MGDYIIKDTVNDSQNTNAQTQTTSNAQNVKDVKQTQQGKVATEQQLPQTGVDNYVPQLVFNISLLALIVVLAFKMGMMFGRRDA